MNRKKKNRKAFTNPFLSRNRGAVCGRNAAFFLLSVLFVAGKFIAAVLFFAPLEIYRRASHWRQNRLVAEVKPASRVLSDGLVQAEGFLPLIEKPDVSFDDVVGLAAAKDLIHSRMILPFKFPDKADAYRVRRGGGLLLFGPKGTGKTTLAKAIACEIDAAFFHLKPSQLVRGEVGKSEQLIEDLFVSLRRHPKAVLFFDEAEELTQSRGANRSTIMKRLISQFLQEWDGLGSQKENHALLVIGATNLPWQVDSAFIRTDRFDFLVYVGLPDLASRVRLLRDLLSGRLVSPDLSLESLAQKTEGYSGADIKGLVNEAAAMAFSKSLGQKENPPITFEDFSAAAEKVRPSVSPNELKRYEEFRKARQLL